MKRISLFSLFLTLIFGLSFHANASISVTVTWDTPGALASEAQIGAMDMTTCEIPADVTSHVFTLDSTWGSLRLYAADGYNLVNAVAEDGNIISPNKSYNPPFILIDLKTYNGQTIHVNVVKPERKDPFTINIVNGVEYLSAEFNSGYTLDLKSGDNTYMINPEYDTTLTLSLIDIASAYEVKLNGTEVAKNNFFPKYENIKIKPGDILFIQVFEDAEPIDCSLKLEYSEGMEGCLHNIYNRTVSSFIDLSSIVDNTLIVKENTELKINFVENDYIFSKIILNNKDITSDLSNNSITFVVTEEDNVLKIEGTPRTYNDIDFTGYIINAEGVDLFLSYQGTPFDIPEGVAVSTDIIVDSSWTMSAEETKKYVIPISEKEGKFFFSPKKGYYISNLFTLTPEGKVEQHSGSASISAKIDGTTFYMMVQKLPESYTANLNVTGTDFNLHIGASSPLSDSWGNPSNPVYSSAQGEREISFIPGYGTPLVFAFVGDETQKPALYLDGAAAAASLNDNSGAIEYFITPYSPTAETTVPSGVHSTITVYNSFNERPELSGASLAIEDGLEAGFFYSPVLHVADPAGQEVISGTQFTVRPASKDVIVTYQDKVVALNENHEYVFNATGEASANVVKIFSMPAAPPYPITPEHGSTVDNLSTITISFPDVKAVEYNETGILLAGPQTNASSTDVHGSDNEWYVSFHNPSVSGEYTVIFPAGAFTLDGEPSLMAVAVYNFKTGWELLPAPGSTVENLDEIVLSFPEAQNVEYVGESYSFVLSNGFNFAAPGYNCVKDENASVPTFRLTLSKGVVPPVGSYTFTIEEGTFMIDEKPSSEIFANYTIERESSTDYIQTPEGTIVYQDYGYDFALIFEEGTTVGKNIDKNKIKLTFDEAEMGADDYTIGTEANMLMFMVTNPDFIKEGHIKLEIAAEAFMLGTTPSPEILAEWDVVAPKTFEAEVTTKNATDVSGIISDLSEVYVFFPDAQSGEIFQKSGAQLRSNDYSYSQSGTITIDDKTTSGVKFIITFDPAPAKDGQYSLSIHGGTFTLDGVFASPDIEYTFNFRRSSGIDSILGDENNCITVVSLDGKLLLDKAPVEKLRNLEKGIYIINGKKIHLK